VAGNSHDLLFGASQLSKLKAHLRWIGARSFTGLFEAIGETCDLFTPDECWNYFCEAGYAST